MALECRDELFSEYKMQGLLCPGSACHASWSETICSVLDFEEIAHAKSHLSSICEASRKTCSSTFKTKFRPGIQLCNEHNLLNTSAWTNLCFHGRLFWFFSCVWEGFDGMWSHWLPPPLIRARVASSLSIRGGRKEEAGGGGREGSRGREKEECLARVSKSYFVQFSNNSHN